MLRSLLMIGLLALSGSAMAQEFNLPPDYALETPDDFEKYKPFVVQGVEYLINSPIDQEPEKRLQVNMFLLQWIGGSPNISIGLQDDIVTFVDCDECLMVFMGGWGKYAIEKNDGDIVKGNMAGLESAIRLYKNNRKILGKSEALEKYIRLKDKGELESYVASKV